MSASRVWGWGERERQREMGVSLAVHIRVLLCVYDNILGPIASTLAMLTFRARSFSVVGHPVHWRVLGSTPDLHTLSASGQTVLQV